MRELADELLPSGTLVVTESLDVADATALTEGLRRIRSALGAIDVLIYNAVGFTGEPPSRLAPASLQADLIVGVTSALTAVQVILPGMTAAGAGTILLTGGGAALYPSAAMGSLPMTKAALRALAFALHDELTPRNIHVGTVTIAGGIGDRPELAPERIAQEFWAVHQQPPGEWTVETIYPTRS